MFDDILVPVDGRGGVEAAIDHAIAVADRFDAAVRVLFVADDRTDATDADGEPDSEGEAVVESVAATVRDRGVDCGTAVVRGDPAEAIADYADAEGMDVVVMPTRGRTGLSRYLLGSVTEMVVRLSTVPVLTVRTRDGARTAFPYENVMVPTDGSEVAGRAADRAADLAASLDATLHAVSVVDDAALGFDVRSVSLGDEFEAVADEAVASAADRVREAGVENVVERVRHGTVHRELLAYVEDNDVDLVVMGATGLGGVDRVLLGSVTDRLVRASPVPVLTVRE